MIKIEKKIAGYSVVDNSAPAAAPASAPATVQPVDDKPMDRGEVLRGSTYKIKPPINDMPSMYITINDMVFNAGTPEEFRRPFEIFINSKNMEHYQWVVALTRVVSAVFRTNDNVAFLVEEFGSVFDPKGGYFKKGGKYMPSLVAEIGSVIEQHLKSIGVIKDEEMDAHRVAILAEKRAQYEEKNGIKPGAEESSSTYPAGATVCTKCHEKAVIRLDGCDVCLACSDSKCQ